MAVAPGLNAALLTRWRRFDGPSRLGGIDLARGLAVVGMLAAHLVAIDDFALGDPATWIDVVNGRSSILFATLAGVSIALVTGGRTPMRGSARGRASARLAVRAGGLWVLGILLVATGVPVYVILPAYAILFLLALPFLGMRPPLLFAIAAAVAVVMPFLQAVWDASPFWDTPEGASVGALIGWAYPFPLWIAFLLSGMAVGRTNLRSARVAFVLLLSGAALAAGGYGLAAWSGSSETDEPLSLLAAVWTARAHSGGVLEVVGSGGFALAVIGASLLLCRTVLRWLVVPLRAVGAMPLTAYTAQLVVWAVAAVAVFGTTEHLDAFRSLEPFWPMTLGITAACTLWVILVGRGPLEAAMAWLTRAVVRGPAEARR
ncbi:heparan-alpha-glucosaminide N-acetyltransferase domain-containing protein [Microbacterium sp. RD1]|uniref:heparan-alpha-glucosaminide N-acetyltransferase domain-containing protein n=1 Tax=Microbacterium sp. RD1 TaxID=3457313 RepID=UPI003FA59E3B